MTADDDLGQLRVALDRYSPSDREALVELAGRLRLNERDEREQHLLVLGSWTDGVRRLCECCGTAVVLVEHLYAAAGPVDPIRPRPSWAEVLEDHGSGLTGMVFRTHDGERCRSLRSPAASGG